MSDEVKAALQLFWDKDVKKVSPGALGMTLQGKPLEDDEARMVAERFPFARWDGTWIVLEGRPEG